MRIGIQSSRPPGKGEYQTRIQWMLQVPTNPSMVVVRSRSRQPYPRFARLDRYACTTWGFQHELFWYLCVRTTGIYSMYRSLSRLAITTTVHSHQLHETHCSLRVILAFKAVPKPTTSLTTLLLRNSM